MAPADDDALKTALAQFNQGLKVQQSEARAERAIGKAERAKQSAAAALKKLDSNPETSSDERAEAETAYRAALGEWNRLRSGEPPDEQAASPDEPGTNDEPSEAAIPEDTTDGDAPAEPPEAPAEEPAEESSTPPEAPAEEATEV